MITHYFYLVQVWNFWNGAVSNTFSSFAYWTCSDHYFHLRLAESSPALLSASRSYSLFDFHSAVVEPSHSLDLRPQFSWSLFLRSLYSKDDSSLGWERIRRWSEIVADGKLRPCNWKRLLFDKQAESISPLLAVEESHVFCLFAPCRQNDYDRLLFTLEFRKCCSNPLRRSLSTSDK